MSGTRYLLIGLAALCAVASAITGAGGVALPEPTAVVPVVAPPAPPQTDPPFGLRVGIEIAIGSQGRTKYGSPPSNACYEIDSLCKLQGWSSKLVTYDSINTTAKLANYDVIVTGDIGYSDNDFLNYQDTLKKWVENGGGLVTMGWAVYGIAGKNAANMDAVCAVKAIPGGYGFLSSGTVHITNNSHPITTGVGDFNVQGYGEYANNDLWPGATRLGNYSGASSFSSIACRDVGTGRAVYLGPVFFGTFGGYPSCRLYYSDVNARLLIKQSIEWAGVNSNVGCTKLIAPSGNVDSTTTITPACSVYNFGSMAATYKVRLRIGTFTDSATVTSHAPGTAQYVTFASWTAMARGTYAVSCSTELAVDADRSNDKKTGSVTVNVKDVGPISITRPKGNYAGGAVVVPAATWKNFGTSATGFDAWMILLQPGGARYYTQKITIPSLAPGGTIQIGSFPPCTLRVGGTWTARCSSYVAGDGGAANDFFDSTFTVTGGGPPPPGSGWIAKSQMPLSPSGKEMKDGAWLTYDASKSRIYVAKGYKKADFYAYDPAGDSWSTLLAWPLGIEAKGPSKGAVGVSDGNGKVYAVKGNNTQGFWLYDAAANTWTQKKDIPLGLSNKKVKGGTDIEYSNGKVYLLKGYKSEFYKYDPAGDSWSALADAPAGANPKWDKGSWLANNGAGKLYAHKAKYHEFYSFNTLNDSWGPSLNAMPLAGITGSKKSKDGGCGAYSSGAIYALKGGNTTQFFKYDVAGNAWSEKETIPQIAPGAAKKKKVKGGGDIVAVGASYYAIKGNRAPEIWQYKPGAYGYEPGTNHDGIATGAEREASGAMRVSPNPLATGYATISYSLPRPGVATVTVSDVAGRVVLQTQTNNRSQMTLDLRDLRTGVYLVRLSSEGFSTTQKLVVQH